MRAADAALELWETRGTEDVIAAMEAEPDPEARLRRLFTHAVEAGSRNPTEVRLPATADHPQVTPVLRRVTERRIGYVTQLYREIGWAPAAARRRALLAFSSYLGHVQLAHAVPGVLPGTEREWQRHVDATLTALLRRG